MYRVVQKKSITKAVKKMPEKERKLFSQLVIDLKDYGPMQKKWPNFSKLGENQQPRRRASGYVVLIR